MIDSTTFYLALHFTNLTGRAVRITSDSVNLSTVLSKYYEFIDVFNKAKVEILASYCLYDLQTKLENGKKPSIGTIYSLSIAEQEALKEFINENLNMRFIQLISFSHRVLVLFVKKKDNYLYLCINF